MRSFVAAVVFLYFFCQSIFAQGSNNTIVSVGATRGISLTDTRSRPASEFGLDFYPAFLKRKVGLSYVFVYRHPRFGIAKPFAVNRVEIMHFVGPTVRFISKGRVQPWVSGGAVLYGDKISISFFNDVLLKASKRKTTASASAGVNLFLSKSLGLVLMPEVRLAGISRPLWQLGGRIGWQFGKRK